VAPFDVVALNKQMRQMDVKFDGTSYMTFCLVALKSIKTNRKSVWIMKYLSFFSLINFTELCLRCVQKCM